MLALKNGRFPLRDWFGEFPISTMIRNTMDDFSVPALDIDVKETDDKIILTADTPGVKREEIDISVENGLLTISFERKEEKSEASEKYSRRERRFGKVSRSFRIDDVQIESTDATLADGVLKIELPKFPAPTAKRIEVRSK